MARIYIHIGLPKTATTTLQQILFPEICDDTIDYLGVGQPRGKIENHLIYELIMKALRTGDGISSVSESLTCELQKGKDLLLSEEMIVVGDWNRQIENLSKITQSIDYKILVTVRELASVIFSYYVERHAHFERTGENFLDLAINNEEMKIYHASIFFEKLYGWFNPDRVYVAKFEDLINCRFANLEEFLDRKTKIAALPTINTKNGSTNFIRTHEINLFNFVRQKFQFLCIKNSGCTQLLKKTLKPFGKSLRKISLPGKRIKKRPESEMDLLRKSLSADYEFLNRQFEIDYLQKPA